MPKSTLGAGLPPLPNTDQQGPLSGGGAQPSGPAAQASLAPPAPTHGQTVAALRHFRIIRDVLRKLLENPDLGKVDIRSEAIDAISILVGDRVIDAPTAVKSLTGLPDKPADQRKAIEQLYASQIQGEVAVLDHHRSQTVGTGNYELENMLHNQPDPDDHQDMIKSMMQAHYPGQNA